MSYPAIKAVLASFLFSPLVAWAAGRITVENVGLASPESVVHDTVDDVYYVSNINGGIADKDGNGFISRVAPDGSVLALKWADGANDGTTLHAPKGLAIAGRTLYVADIDTVRLFDLATGKPQGEVPIPGATFLNGLAALPSGEVVGTESALLVDGTTVTPTKKDFIYRIGTDRRVAVVAQTPELNQPNGIAVLASGQFLVSTRGAAEVYELTPGGEKRNVRTLPGTIVDGVGLAPDGRIFASSWETSEVYTVTPDGQVSTPFGKLAVPAADFHFDLQRGRILLPLLRANSLVFAPLS
ncbi:periplasmic ATP/GTP-binding protein [plant metagenome]|uniref:Periplasmic ATP/GTP-binding protein n=1 Tax=plant metagenome TaxID=1297885 RepID=A0A484S699_9ZZZZ